MTKADCILSFAATWLAARSAVDQDDCRSYDALAGQALDEAEAAWAAINKAVADKEMTAECEARGRTLMEAMRVARQATEGKS